MLLSMTGFGNSRGQTDALRFRIEVRSVNNRHFKLTLRGPEPYTLLESEFEKVIRRFIRRGTVLLQLRIDRVHRSEEFRLNSAALQSYLQQIADVLPTIRNSSTAPLSGAFAGALSLPGVSLLTDAEVDTTAEWPALESGLVEAMTKLQSMRADEGKRMAAQLAAWRDEIAGLLVEIRKRQPMVMSSYRERLRERIQLHLSDAAVAIEDDDLIREVAVYADRSDITEEIVRLDSHLQQFAEMVRDDDESPGRKLEFVAQEMGREVNTMGSKAGDIEISRRVVEIKAILEKVRELLQNIE